MVQSAESVMWCPEIMSGSRPIYERLVLTMERDIRSGVLGAGVRLPPQRELAFRLGVSVGSVTRAYTEAERRGLLSAHVGRGSFVRGGVGRQSVSGLVSGRVQGSGGGIDLRRNLPPLAPGLEEALPWALQELMLQPEAMEAVLTYTPGPGLETVRAAAVQWLAEAYGLNVEPEQIVQCNGGQHGIALVFSAFCQAGETVLCEAATFYGARTAADHLGLVMRGVRMDAEGMCPEALDRAAAETGSRLLFVQPTLHNPTTRTMSVQRRKEIAAVARARNLLILEDDAYYAYSDQPPQLVMFAPERTLYLASLSKGVCPGFRLAFLVLPPEVSRRGLMRGIRALGYCPSALGALVFRQWVLEGRIGEITRSILGEVEARFEMARLALGAHMAEAGGAFSPHVWVPLPVMKAEGLVTRLLQDGVLLAPQDAADVSDDAPSGVRVCLGATFGREDLAQGLSVLRAALEGDERVVRDGLI